MDLVSGLERDDLGYIYESWPVMQATIALITVGEMSVKLFSRSLGCQCGCYQCVSRVCQAYSISVSPGLL